MAKRELLPHYSSFLLILGLSVRFAASAGSDGYGYYSNKDSELSFANIGHTFLYPYANCSLIFDSQNVTYDRCLDLEGGFQLFWDLPSNSSGSHYVNFTFSGQSDNEWVSVGKSAKGLMIRSSAMIGYSNGSDGLSVLQYYLAGKIPSQIYPGGNLTVKDEVGQLSGGVLTIQFSLLLNETELNSTIFIWAKGPYDSVGGTLRRHKEDYSGLVGIFVDPVVRTEVSTASQVPAPSEASTGCDFIFGGSTESYANCQKLEGGFVLMWNSVQSGTNYKVSIAFNHSNTGYIGLGFGSSMRGTSAIIARSSSSGVEVKQYYLASYMAKDNLPKDTLDVSDLQGETTSSSLSMKFSIVLSTSQVSASNLIWAHGTYDSSKGDVLNYHSYDHSGSVNFLQGTVAKGPVYSDKLKNSHGVVNAVGWGIVIPIGIIIARYFRFSDPLWFYLHIVCQLIGFGLGLAGFITGIAIKNKSNHTENPHYSFGIAILALSIFQVTALALRPKKGVSMARRIWNFFHHWSGRATLILGVVNIYIGFDLLKPDKKYKVAFSVVFAILCIIALVLEIAIWSGAIKRTPEKETQSSNVESEMAPKKSSLN